MFEGKEVYYDIENDELFIRLFYKDYDLVARDRALCSALPEHPGGILHVIEPRLLKEALIEGRYIKLGTL